MQQADTLISARTEEPAQEGSCSTALSAVSRDMMAMTMGCSSTVKHEEQMFRRRAYHAQPPSHARALVQPHRTQVLGPPFTDELPAAGAVLTEVVELILPFA